MKRILRRILQAALSIFFGEIALVGRDRIPKKGPCIICANHPSAGMDGMLIGSVFGVRVHYLAKATLFRGLVGRFLAWLGAIPVYRRQDDPAGEEPGSRNAEAFAKAHELLARGGWLAIFPEGGSKATRHLSRLKTGAARIALEAEAKAGFSLGTKLLPVALVYSAQTVFRSRVALAVAKPIEVATFQERYEADPAGAVHELTATIDARLRRELAYVPDDSLHNLALAIADLYEVEELPAPDRIAAREEIRDAVIYFSEHDPDKIAKVLSRLDRYRHRLERHRLSSSALAVPREAGSRLLLGAELLLGWPVAAFGAIGNLVPYNVPRLLLAVLKPDPTNVSSLKLAIGAGSFGLFYALEGYAAHLVLSPPTTLLYLLSLPLSGIYALRYVVRVQGGEEMFRILSLLALRGSRRRLAVLMRERDAILKMLEKARLERVATLP